jgi:cytochrome c
MNKSKFFLGLALVSGTVFTSVAMAGMSQEEGLALAKKSGCLACHAIDKKVVGPPWMEVSKKYKGVAEMTAKLTDGSEIKGPPKEVLNTKVHKGGKGNWTAVTHGVPMPPYSPRVSDADIATLVDFVLGLAQ